MSEDTKSRMKEAGERAVENRRKGFHCSESVFMAINDTLKITDPSMVRMVTGFHGGGGTRRKEPGVDLKGVLEELASGRDRRPREELPVTQIGHLCGAIASGIVCIGLLYGRTSPSDDLVCVDEISYELHRRFMEEFGERECRPLRETFVPLSSNHTCENVYKRGAEIAVELILEASRIVPECPEKL
ncbi:MAG: C-GCAxxG-C-C family protein [Pseudomonadota bacterium]